MAGRTYAIGDIHGRFDLLERALVWIEGHARQDSCVRIVFLGDYVDRGPDSQKVVERLMAGPSRSGDDFICLMGNHEEMLLRAAEQGSEAAHHWLRNGGDATLQSYGDVVPLEHLEWMRKLPLLVEDEHRIFIHAGLSPTRSIADQSDYNKLWIREPFLSANHDFGKHVVHGHTPQDGKPDLRQFRTNLDTGAVWTGRLCIAVFDNDKPGGPVRTQIITV